jgi:hypothetical protein
MFPHGAFILASLAGQTGASIPRDSLFSQVIIFGRGVKKDPALASLAGQTGRLSHVISSCGHVLTGLDASLHKPDNRNGISAQLHASDCMFGFSQGQQSGSGRSAQTTENREFIN